MLKNQHSTHRWRFHRTSADECAALPVQPYLRLIFYGRHGPVFAPVNAVWNVSRIAVQEGGLGLGHRAEQLRPAHWLDSGLSQLKEYKHAEQVIVSSASGGTDTLALAPVAQRVLLELLVCPVRQFIETQL